MNASGKKPADIHKRLIEQCRKGNRKAQGQIYRLYYKAMFNTSFRITGNLQESEDIMQESFLSAFRKLDQFSGEVSFGAWLKKIVINRSLDHLRQKKVELEDISDYESQLAIEEPEEVNPEIPTSQIIREIEKLAPRYRIVISLYLLEGYDHEEISGILGISPSTSRSQYVRARKKLSENLKKR